MKIDTATAARFLAALTGDTVHTFQTFAEAHKGDRSLSRVLHGPLDAHVDTLQMLNYKGAGVFLMVNRGDGRGRKGGNVTEARALFLDLDGAPLDPVLASALPPKIVVESSPGKWHCYWPVVDLPLDRFTDAQKALAAQFNGDTKVHDRARVMRLPGFLHNKDKPFQTRLVECADDPVTWTEMVEAFNLPDRMRLPDTIPSGQRNDTLFKLALSAARKGIPHAEQLKKAQAVNVARCDPPLDEAEVAQAVASAYQRPAQGVVGVPLAVMDSDAYRALDDGARTLLLLAYRHRDTATELFSLTFTECKPWVACKKRFTRHRRKLIASGLLVKAVNAKPAMPRKGRGPEPFLFRVAIGDKLHPYSKAPIGDKYNPPELLQGGAVSAVGREKPRRRSR